MAHATWLSSELALTCRGSDAADGVSPGPTCQSELGRRREVGSGEREEGRRAGPGRNGKRKDLNILVKDLEFEKIAKGEVATKG